MLLRDGENPLGNRARQKQIVAAACVHHPGPQARSAAATPEEIPAYRTPDRAARVLGDDQTTHRIGMSKPLVGFNPDRNPEGNERPIDRDAPLRGQGNALGTDWPVPR